MRRKFVVVVVLLVVVFTTIQSCARKPFACFKTDVDEDSIHINQPVTFSAECSSNTEEYFWEFYDNLDSIEFEATVTKAFKDTGSVKVTLSVANGNKIASSTKYFQVKP